MDYENDYPDPTLVIQKLKILASKGVLSSEWQKTLDDAVLLLERKNYTLFNGKRRSV